MITIDRAREFFLYRHDDMVADAAAELGLSDEVAVDRGYTLYGEPTGGDLLLSNGDKLGADETINLAIHMGAAEWYGPTRFDIEDFGAPWIG